MLGGKIRTRRTKFSKYIHDFHYYLKFLTVVDERASSCCSLVSGLQVADVGRNGDDDGGSGGGGSLVVSEGWMVMTRVVGRSVCNGGSYVVDSKEGMVLTEEGVMLLLFLI